MFSTEITLILYFLAIEQNTHYLISDQNTIRSIKQYINGLNKISNERIFDELKKILTLKIEYRLFSFFDTETGTYNFQSDKALDSIMSGGFFGKGIGEGTLKNRVPEAHTDYIISVISEEFGVIAIMLILVLFLELLENLGILNQKYYLHPDGIRNLIIMT